MTLARLPRLIVALSFCALLTVPVSHLSAVPASPVLFHASFDDTLDAAGASGRAKPLVVDGKVEYRDGKVGRALLCGGDGALVKYPVEGHVRPTRGTVEMWVKAVDWPRDEQAFHVFFETEGPGWLVLYKFWTGGVLMLSGADHEHYTSAWLEPSPLRTGDWHHLAGVWQRNRLALYVDGVLKRSHSVPSLPQSLKGGFAIGDAGWGKPHSSHTLIDEVKVYRYALPDDQIALAAQGKPVTYRPEVYLDIQPRPSKGQWTVTVDGSGFVGEDGPGTMAAVEVLSAGKTTAQGKVEKFEDGLGTVSLDTSKVPAGPQVVRATILAAAGKEVARMEVPFEKPADAPWMSNRIGLVDRVLPPFTEIRAGGVRAVEARKPFGPWVQCWGRKYVMDGLFPTQIESAGQPMLAEPIRLSVATEAGEVAFGKSTGRISGWSPTCARHTGSAAVPGLSLTTDTTIEYDGMLWTNVTLTPKRPTTLTGLTVHLPVRGTNATYFHHARGVWGDDNAGFLPEKGYESLAFQPFLWVGDDDRGLGWFAESQQFWSNAPGKPVQRIVRNGDVVEMLIHVINRPTKVESVFRLSFGLQATPVKPRPAKARGWRLGNLGTAENLSDPSAGNIQVLWCNGNLAHFGYPWPKDPERFRALVADLHSRNIRAIPYVNLNFLSTGAPEWAYYAADWTDPGRSFSGGDVGEMGHDLLGACPSVPAWRDFIAYKVARFVEEFKVDGIYIDCWEPNTCLVEDHGCGWRDAAGNPQGRVPLRAMREIVRRIREVLVDRRPDPHLIIHMSADVTIPMLAFADSILDGEQYQAPDRDPKDDYLGLIPLDKWRAEHTGIQWGVFPFFLPEFTGERRRTTLATERLMGLMLAHDISPWPIWCNSQVIFDAWKTVDRFGLVEAEFLPYWKPNGATTDNREVLVSVYRKPGRALLAVLNSGTSEAEMAVKVDAKRLGVRPSFVVKNATDDSSLASSDGVFKLTLPGRGYRLVVVQ